MTLFAQELIRARRDGRALTADELGWLVGGITDGGLSDAQVGAFAMAVFFQGLSDEERVAFTAAMRDSGRVLSWHDVTDRPVLDKHSTGGVGDKVSLPLAQAVVGAVGCAIIGQTGELAPADKRLYAIRGATGSVESIPLIVASILSKKLAAGLDGLVMDVKHGDGAFMADISRARELARALVDVAGANGLPTIAVLTDMNSVLGTTAGNAVEVAESIAMLTDPGAADPRLIAVTLELAERLLEPHGLDPAGARRALDDGSAAERFAVMVAALGGPADLLERPERHLPPAPIVRPVHPEAVGRVTAHDTRLVGFAVMALGGGRSVESGRIDHAVGFSALAPVGAGVGPDRPLAVVHARDESSFAFAAASLRGAMPVGEHVDGAGVVTEVVR